MTTEQELIKTKQENYELKASLEISVLTITALELNAMHKTTYLKTALFTAFLLLVITFIAGHVAIKQQKIINKLQKEAEGKNSVIAPLEREELSESFKWGIRGIVRK